jgi:hypothetical protein
MEPVIIFGFLILLGGYLWLLMLARRRRATKTAKLAEMEAQRMDAGDQAEDQRNR